MTVIHKFSVSRRDDLEAPRHLSTKLDDLHVWRDYYIEFAGPVTAEKLQRVGECLINPHTETVIVDRPLPARAVQVMYHRGIVDNESDSICEMAAMAGSPAVAARVARVYSSKDPALVSVIAEHACNPNIESLIESEEPFNTLLPAGSYQPAQWFDLTSLNEDDLEQLGRSDGRSLELDKMRQIVQLQTKMGWNAVSDALLESLDARWSDHCAHTTWKAAGDLLKVLMASSRDTKNQNIVSMFYDNAGIWDFYDGYGIALKAETHNGPTAVSAYFGQLTKIGGVLRDILGTGKGADPIGVFEYTATGIPGTDAPIANRPNPKQIAHETIRAVKEYGNTFGVPMMSSRMEFHHAYRAKPFALGGSIGLIPNQYAAKGEPQPGDLALIIGGLTGNDGIHGASASSAGAEMDTTSVQIGSPLEEIQFREAIIEMRDQGLIRAITDMGAAGVNSAFGEMGEACGIWINTALVPLKTSGLAMWRILISESQERMALCVSPDDLSAAREVMDKHRVRNAVIGRFTNTAKFCVVHDDAISQGDVIDADVAQMPKAREVGFELPYELASYRPAQVSIGDLPPIDVRSSNWNEVEGRDLHELAVAVASHAQVASQAFASEQYDSSVGGRTHYGPVTRGGVATGYWAAKPLYSSNAAVTFSTAFNPALFAAHPLRAVRQNLIGVLCQQVLAGVALQDVCLSDNFYTPHLSEGANEWLSAMVHEIANLARTFGTPFISGKDSSAGSVNTPEGTVHVPPAVFLAALGKVPDAARLRPETWTSVGNVLVQVGLVTPSLAGTVLGEHLGSSANDVDDIEVQDALRFLDVLQSLSLDVAPSARMIGSGGLFAVAMKGAIDSRLGVNLDVSESSELFAENRCCALLEVTPDQVAALPDELHARVVGKIVDDHGGVTMNGTELLTARVRSAFYHSFRSVLS